jgi:hypothetical protein
MVTLLCEELYLCGRGMLPMAEESHTIDSFGRFINHDESIMDSSIGDACAADDS